MDTTTLTALIKDDLTAMALAWQTETATRRAASPDGISAIAGELFPGVDALLLSSNRDVTNYLQQAVSRYLRALKRGELNWEWEGDGSEPDARVSPGTFLNHYGRDLVQDASTDALVSGKLAFFSYLTPERQLRMTTLTGFLWPIYEPGDVNTVAALVQITSATRNDKLVYEVRRYSPGLLEVYGGLDDWREYAAKLPERFETPATAGRMPVAFRIVGRGLDRRPEGLAQTALPSARRYAKFSILLGFIATRGGFEERLVKSDQLFQLAKDNPRHPLVQELKKVGVNLVRLVDSGGSYERLDPVALGEYREQEAVARGDLLNVMNVPDTSGSTISGDALSEKRESYTETVESLASSLADALTEASELGAALAPTLLRPGFRVTLEPRFTRDTQAERKMLLEEFKVGLPKSAWLSGLQSLGVSQVTQAHIDAALAEEKAMALPVDDGT